MNVLKNLRLVPGESGKRSGLGLLLSMAKQELQRTEGMLAQVQEIRALQSQLDRHDIHVKQASQRDGSHVGERVATEPAVNALDMQDMAANLEDLRRREAKYKQQLQTFLAEYKKRGHSSS